MYCAQQMLRVPPLLMFPGFPTQVHSAWLPVVKIASLCLGASGSCWSLFCRRNSRRNKRGMGLPGATSNKRPMGVGTEVPQVLHPGVCALRVTPSGEVCHHPHDWHAWWHLLLAPCPPLSYFPSPSCLQNKSAFQCLFQLLLLGESKLRRCTSPIYVRPKSTNVRGWAWWPLCLPRLDSSLQPNERGYDDPHLKRLWAWKSFVQGPKLRHKTIIKSVYNLICPLLAVHPHAGGIWCTRWRWWWSRIHLKGPGRWRQWEIRYTMNRFTSQDYYIHTALTSGQWNWVPTSSLPLYQFLTLLPFSLFPSETWMIRIKISYFMTITII